MKTTFRLFATLVLLVFVAACGEKSSSSSAGILDEISGVWRAKGDGTMVSIIYAEKKIRLLFGDDSLPVSLGEVDNANKTANMNVTLINGKPGVWTIRQIWDKEKTSFHLQLTLHDGTQDELSFVRKISADDLNKIANAEARTRPGSIGDAAKATEAVTPAAPPTQAQPVPTPPVVAPVAEQAPIVPSAPASITWMPSFDCAKVSTGSERLVCSSKELSEADVKLAVAYKAATNISADKDSLRSAQNAWRKNERDACSDVQCMLGAYQNRLAQLAR
jgi:uncharacterized protein YecT (DUF1311 family)